MNLRNLEGSIVFNDNQLTKKIVFDTEEALCFVLNLKPGQTLPVHQHENSTVIIKVIQGRGQIQINDEVQNIHKDSAIMASGKDSFGIPTVEQDLSLFVTLTPKPANTKFAQEIG